MFQDHKNKMRKDSGKEVTPDIVGIPVYLVRRAMIGEFETNTSKIRLF